MHDFFTRAFENLIGRTEGPMSGRLLIQPLVACILAVRAGLRDARQLTIPRCGAVEGRASWAGRQNMESRNSGTME